MKFVLYTSILLTVAVSLSAQSIRAKVQKGNEQYKNEKYEEALASYKDALLDDPLNEVALFNDGAASYKLKKYDQALEAYQKVTASKNLTKRKGLLQYW